MDVGVGSVSGECGCGRGVFMYVWGCGCDRSVDVGVAEVWLCVILKALCIIVCVDITTGPCVDITTGPCLFLMIFCMDVACM